MGLRSDITCLIVLVFLFLWAPPPLRPSAVPRPRPLLLGLAAWLWGRGVSGASEVAEAVEDISPREMDSVGLQCEGQLDLQRKKQTQQTQDIAGGCFDGALAERPRPSGPWQGRRVPRAPSALPSRPAEGSAWVLRC